MIPTEFLRARYAEEENAARIAAATPRAAMNITRWHPAHVLADIASKRKILELHESWPVLIRRPEPEVVLSTDGLGQVFASVSERMEWITNQEYRKRFGDEPPTSPIILALLQPYAEHPDFEERWRSWTAQ